MKYDESREDEYICPNCNKEVTRSRIAERKTFCSRRCKAAFVKRYGWDELKSIEAEILDDRVTRLRPNKMAQMNPQKYNSRLLQSVSAALLRAEYIKASENPGRSVDIHPVWRKRLMGPLKSPEYYEKISRKLDKIKRASKSPRSPS